MKKISLLILILAAAIFGLTGTASAAVLFNFESPLVDTTNVTTIGQYMSQLFDGTTTSVTLSSTVQAISDSDLLGPDRHLESTGEAQPHGFTITFSVPISSVEFDWGREHDQYFYAYGDGNLIFSDSGSKENESVSGHFASSTFSSPVSVLYFHDTTSGETEIDNLSVTKADVVVPEPASMLLLGMGILGIFGLKRKLS